MRDSNCKKKPGVCLMVGGLLLIAAAFLLTGYNLWDDWRANQAAEKVMEQMPTPAEMTELSSLDPDEQKIPDYILNPVMSDWSYPRLKISPCRYAGTAYKNGFVIAGHNYRRHFGLLSRLAVGDQVTFTDVDGNAFCYQVTEVQVLNPTAIEEMVSDDWDLSLFTCTLGGQTRLTVRCEKVDFCD